MRLLSFVLTLFVFYGSAQAQNQISINASSEVMVPADKIAFQINLNAEASTPQEAYDMHKEREKVLVNQLKKFDIKDEDINFEPITINKHYDNSYPQKEERKRIQTRQQVVVTLDDFDIYEKIQITLIENNFDEFSGNFLSSESKQGKDKALKKALKIAHDKAHIIARETGLSISGIYGISYSHSQRPPQPMEMMRAKSSDSSLLQFDQTVSVSASVSVTYEFKQK